jgi:hypothetical protein
MWWAAEEEKQGVPGGTREGYLSLAELQFYISCVNVSSKQKAKAIPVTGREGP